MRERIQCTCFRGFKGKDENTVGVQEHLRKSNLDTHEDKLYLSVSEQTFGLCGINCFVCC